MAYSSGTRHIDHSRQATVPAPLLPRAMADIRRRTETDLAINIRKATSIGRLDWESGRRKAG